MKKKEEQRVKKGMKIKIGTPTGANYGYDYSYSTHDIKEVQENPHNNYVPYSITTCCGKYSPTSGADGHWENSMHLGCYEIIEPND